MRLLDIDPDAFRVQFTRAPFAMRHRLASHPLFSMQRLVALARSLPQSRVEYNAGDVPMTLDPRLTPQTGLSPEETIRRIQECNSWMVLKNVELDADYRRLLNDCLDEVCAMSDGLTGGRATRGIRDRFGYIFISSGGARTPYHMDHEENFLLQVRGSKVINVIPPDNRAVLTTAELERFYGGAHRNLVFKEEYRDHARPFELTPGVGVHVPVTAPHWVQNGPEVSVSFSITFQTAASLRWSHVNRVNGKLRRFGLRPSPAGASPMVDAVKQFAFRATDKLARMLAGTKSPAG
jgi:hypothetical protein